MIICWVLLSVIHISSALQLRVEANVSPPQNDIRLCVAFKLDETITYHLRHFSYIINDPEIHHLALGVCDEPASDQKYWSCDGRRERAPNSTMECKGHHMRFLYGEAMGGRDLSLPSDHAYEIGKGTPYKYLVLLSHYGSVTADKRYHSEVTITYDEKPKSDENVVTYPLTNDDTSNIIPPHQKTIIEAYREFPLPLHPVIYNFHAHELGRSISLYVVKRRSTENGLDTWVRLGKRDPRLPQLYLPVENNVTANVGDGFAVRCTYYNDRDTEAKIGLKYEDEMCLVTISSWYKEEDGGKITTKDVNMNISWKEVGLNNIPDDA